MRFAIMFGFFLVATWMRDNPVPDWLIATFVAAAFMDIVEWLRYLAKGDN